MKTTISGKGGFLHSSWIPDRTDCWLHPDLNRSTLTFLLLCEREKYAQELSTAACHSLLPCLDLVRKNGSLKYMETNAWTFQEPLLPKTQSVNCILIRTFLTRSRAQQKHWAWFSLPVHHIWQSCKEWKSHQECWGPCLLITRKLQSIFTWNIWGNLETKIYCSGTYYLPGIGQIVGTRAINLSFQVASDIPGKNAL